jgi:hypothetical protein
VEGESEGEEGEEGDLENMFVNDHSLGENNEVKNPPPPLDDLDLECLRL